MEPLFTKRPLVEDCHYISRKGEVIQREYGMSPLGNLLNGRWVLRDSVGQYIDHDEYCHDLAERNNIYLKE